MGALTATVEGIRRGLETHEREELVRRTRERDQKDRAARREKLFYAAAGLALTAFNIAVQLWG